MDEQTYQLVLQIVTAWLPVITAVTGFIVAICKVVTMVNSSVKNLEKKNSDNLEDLSKTVNELNASLKNIEQENCALKRELEKTHRQIHHLHIEEK